MQALSRYSLRICYKDQGSLPPLCGHYEVNASPKFFDTIDLDIQILPCSGTKHLVVTMTHDPCSVLWMWHTMMPLRSVSKQPTMPFELMD